MDEALIEKDISIPTWRIYFQALKRLIYHPNRVLLIYLML
jgi:hypothetical protein